ncbi:MAG: phytanoyl-CoA dioxygenase family protein [Acidimicrobiales bacterium]
MIAPTFLDARLDAELDANGFVVVDWFTPDEIARLRRDIVEHYPDTRGFATSVEMTDGPYRAGVHEFLHRAFRPTADRLFVDHQMNLTAVAIKWPGDAGVKPLHQDWTLCDETQFRSVNVWAPLVDCSEVNGTLYVLPGSHRVLDRIRPAPRFPTGYEDPIEQLDLTDLQEVRVAAGQAIVMDLAIIHGSPANRTDDPRVVVAANFLPRRSPISYYYCDLDDDVQHYDVDDITFFQRFDFRAPPRDLVSHGSVPFAPPSYSSAQIRSSSEASARRAPARRTAGGATG